MRFFNGRGAVVSVALSLVLLFAFATVLNSAYRNTRRSRAEARYQRGLELAKAGNQADAAEEFRAALTYSHNDPRFSLALAQSLMASGAWSEAEAYLDPLRQNDPTNGPINLMLARIDERQKHDQQAIDYYQRAIYGYWPENPEQNRVATRFELLGLLDRTHQDRQALAELLNLADEVPASDVATRLKVANLLLSHNSAQHAAEIYRSLLADHGHRMEAEEGLGNALFAAGDYAGAANAFRMAERYGASDEGLKQKLAICNEVMALDPTNMRLSAEQRFERAQELVRRVTASTGYCTTIPSALSDAAQKAILGDRKRRRDGDTVDAITAAEQLWTLRQQTCRQPEADRALSAVMAKIQKQP